MIRRLGAVALAGVLLAGCGSVKLSTAMISWAHDNGFAASAKTLSIDAAHVATALRSASSGVNELHTVTGVLLLAAQSAQTQLPTPDDQATNLLNGAYASLGAAANVGYNAAASPLKRAQALGLLAQGLAKLSEGSARVATASIP
ncbi:MAG TPA: hypothetical protein PLG60_00765 [Acidimicrobiales bacterium]|nr:MAG: hypothetical protein B7X07_03750 [Actinobacteria bacterium 21-64-8]HQT99014.1 hypothetical protein [Acidimicrobiales bacterium]